MAIGRTLRNLHRAIAPIIILPLMITILTGVSYRLGKSWFGLSRDQVHWLMVVHEGEYLGSWLEPVYVLLNGLGALFMLSTGIGILWSTLRPKKSAAKAEKPEQATEG